MNKFKRFFIRLLLFVVGFFLILFALYSVSKQNLLSQKLKNANETEIIMHFTHGSLAQKNCNDQRSRLGGKWGGHVALEIDGFIYGFGRRKNPVHIFPSKNYNAVFIKESFDAWEQNSENEKLTSITLPITLEQKENLKKQCARFCETAPYDYATFGKRCTFSAYALLIDNKIFKPQTEIEIHSITVYPALFRKIMVSFAEKNGLKIKRKEGIDCRDWE